MFLDKYFDHDHDYDDYDDGDDDGLSGKAIAGIYFCWQFCITCVNHHITDCYFGLCKISL